MCFIERKKDIRLCRESEKVNPLLAGGCTAAGYQTFRCNNRPCLTAPTNAPDGTLWITILRIPYTAGVLFIITNAEGKRNASRENFRGKVWNIEFDNNIESPKRRLDKDFL